AFEATGKHIVIKTDVDNLVSLVKQKEEISFSDASKTMGVALPTIEAWAQFLEEDGILSIDYRLTQPFLIYTSKEKKVKVPKYTPQMKGASAAEGRSSRSYVELETQEENEDQDSSEEAQQTGEERTSVILSPDEVAKKERKKIDAFLQGAQEEVTKGNLGQALQDYNSLKSYVMELPDSYPVSKTELQGKLVQLGNELAEEIQKHKKEIAERIKKDISAYLSQMQKDIRAKNFPRAEGILKRVDNLLIAFPSGYLKEEFLLQSLVLEAYEALLFEKNKYLSTDLLSKTQKIHEWEHKALTGLEQNDFFLAQSSYEQMKLIFNSFPAGFLKEKIELQNTISSVFSQIMKKQHTIRHNQFEVVAARIQRMLTESSAFIENKRIEETVKAYEQIKKDFESLPDGFFDQKNPLEQGIVVFHKKLARQLHEQSTAMFDMLHKGVMEQLKQVNTYISLGRWDLAQEAYHEMRETYNKFPEGFLERKDGIKKEMVEIYKKILNHSDSQFLSGFDDYVKKRYMTLLSHIVRAHMLVDHKDFQGFLTVWEDIHAAYGLIPLALLEKRTTLHNEVLKIHKAVQAYHQSKQLYEFQKRGDYASLNKALAALEPAT
ncbi:hypothetical protein COY95_03715, partial [Candidatus Woesearchaeota archaeon CG_4_10_14_0_8_um_filter_47_5]